MVEAGICRIQWGAKISANLRATCLAPSFPLLLALWSPLCSCRAPLPGVKGGFAFPNEATKTSGCRKTSSRSLAAGCDSASGSAVFFSSSRSIGRSTRDSTASCRRLPLSLETHLYGHTMMPEGLRAMLDNFATTQVLLTRCKTWSQGTSRDGIKRVVAAACSLQSQERSPTFVCS